MVKAFAGTRAHAIANKTAVRTLFILRTLDLNIITHHTFHISHSFVAAGFTRPPAALFTTERQEESLEQGEVHRHEVIAAGHNLRHAQKRNQEHKSETHAIHHTAGEQQGVQDKQEDYKVRREPAQQLMREEQVGKQRAERVEQGQIGPQVVEVRTANAHLAAELADTFLRGLFRTDSARDKRAETALLQNLRGNEEVVHDALLDRKFCIKFAPNRIEGAVSADKPVEDSLELLDFGFQIPVGTFALAQHTAALVRKDKVTAGTTDFPILKWRHELAHHVGEEHRIRIAEHEDVALRNLLQAVEHGSLAGILRGLHQSDSLVGIARDNFCGAVGRTVVADQYLELFLGVVNFEDVLDFPLDNGFLVVRRNQEGYRRQFKILVDVTVTALEQFAHERERHGENPVAERKQEHEHPERYLQVEINITIHLFIHSSSLSRN